MIFYLSASTDLKDLVIDYIEIKLVTGETVSLNWDESDIERLDNGFNARYKGVYFDEEYANGKLDSLREMQIDKLVWIRTSCCQEAGQVTEEQLDKAVHMDDRIYCPNCGRYSKFHICNPESIQEGELKT